MGTVASVVDTQYAPCGCSPMGKLSQTSRPHTPTGPVYWTVYAYDGIGRTKSVTAPDGASKTLYVYAGALVGVTDAAGKWKTFSTDAVGNLTQVNEPNPAGGADFITGYSYDVLNQLRTVTMTRSGTTQTRTFVYAAWSPVYGITTFNGVGPFLMSSTNPENGTGRIRMVRGISLRRRWMQRGRRLPIAMIRITA